jgi:hypothetical protein
LINIVDNCTEIPGRTDCFAWFSKWLAADDKQVVFRGRSADGFEGLYLYRPETDRLYTITDTTHPIEGRGVISYELSSRPVVGNRIAVMVRFADGGFGEYLASMPGLPVTKLVRHPAAKTGPSSPGK